MLWREHGEKVAEAGIGHNLGWTISLVNLLSMSIFAIENSKGKQGCVNCMISVQLYSLHKEQWVLNLLKAATL